MRVIKSMTICVASIALTACGGGSSGGGGNSPNPPTPITKSVGVNIGNVSTIPLGNGGGSTSAIVTNNFSSQLVLTSATYTLYTGSGAETPQNASATGSPVNTSLCSSIQANGTCSLMINAASATEGQYLVTLNYTNLGDGKTYTTSQLISYSDTVPTNINGVQISTINNTLFNIPGGSTTYSVPFVLTQAVSNLSASSEYNNPAFAPSISCNGSAPYAAGTQCTLFIKIAQTGNAQTISGDITVSTTPSTNKQIRTIVPSIKGQVGYLFNVPVTVVQNNTGNLVTSAINVIVNPATSTQTITLLNNGSASITGITINGNTPTVIGSNGCTGSLATNASCTFTVSAPSITQNAQASVVVNYTSGNTSQSIAFNVVYIIASSTAGMSMTASGNLNNTVINTTNTINVAVTNTGTATLSNISFTAAAALPAGMTYAGNSTCATNGMQTLNAGQSCTLILSYTPTVTSAGPSFVLREAATYVNQGGQSQSYADASATISYTAIAAQAFVYITPNYVAYGIRADNTDTATQTFVIVNASPVSTTVTAETLANPSVTAYTSTGGTCSFPQTLTAAPSAGESCTVVAQFGPTASTISTTSQMNATYITSGSNTATAFANLSFTSSPAALISISSVVESGGTGSGTIGSPYTFTNSPITAPLQFTVTYQNTGTQSATNFNVALNTLPVGYYQVGGTCGTGTTTTTLATSDTCTAIFAAESTALFNSYSLNGSLNFNLPGWSYVDVSTGLNTNTAPTFGSFTPTVYVTANALAAVTESPATGWTTATSGGTNTIGFNVTNAVASTTTISIQNTANFAPSITFGVGSGTGAVAGTCVVTGTSGTCTIPVTNLSNLPVTTYNFLYIVSPTGSSSGILQSGSFAYSS